VKRAKIKFFPQYVPLEKEYPPKVVTIIDPIVAKIVIYRLLKIYREKFAFFHAST
jgi:hypothetical protein